MSEKTEKTTSKEREARRKFLKNAGDVAVAVPVATLLVAASSRKAYATVYNSPEPD